MSLKRMTDFTDPNRMPFGLTLRGYHVNVVANGIPEYLIPVIKTDMNQNGKVAQNCEHESMAIRRSVQRLFPARQRNKGKLFHNWAYMIKTNTQPKIVALGGQALAN